MARLWSSGLELNSTTSAMEFESISAGGTTVSSIIRSGIYALRSNSTGSGQQSRFAFKSAATADGFYVRAYVRIDSYANAIASFIALWQATGSNQKVAIQMNSDGTLELWNIEDSAQIGSDSSVLSLNTWHLLELKVDCTTIASTAIEAKINGTAFASGTINLAAGISSIQLGFQGFITGDLYFDDIAINDDTGSFQNSWPEEGKIIHLKPNAAGDNSAWTNDYLSVDEVTPDNATTLVSSNTLDQIDDHNIEAPASLGTSDTINVVQVGARFNGVGASANASFVLRIKAAASGTVEESSAITPASATWVTNAAAAPRNYSLTLYDLPGESTTVWTKADLEAAQIGYRLSATSTNAAQLSTIWLLVDYTPVYGTLKAKPRRPVINWKI